MSALNIIPSTVTVKAQTLYVERIRTASSTSPGRPVLVFLHEALGSVALWKAFPRLVCQKTGLDALLYDRQGHGRSARLQAPRALDYLEDESWLFLPGVLERHNIQNPIFIGHSDGGTIALMYAAKFPQAVAGLVSMAAHVFVDELTLKGIRKAQSSYRTTGLRQRLTKYHGDKTDALFAAWAETWCAPAFRSWNILKLLPRIQCPVLAIQGQVDRYGTRAQLDHIVEGTGGPARRLWIPNCGHMPHLQAPEPTVSAITAFVNEWI